MPLPLSPKLFCKAEFYSRTRVVGDCLEWTGAKEKDGYGTLRVNLTRYRAHRVSWAMRNGRDPGDMFVCHSCDNPACVKPDHLWLGTPAENVADMVQKGRTYRHDYAGEKHPAARLTEDDVRRIRTRPKKQRELAEEYGVALSTIANIQVGNQWAHVK